MIAPAVEITGDPSRECLSIGGVQVPFAAATLNLTPGSLPVLTVDLPVIGNKVVSLDAAHPVASSRTRRALVAMGWTPPPGAPARAGDAPAPMGDWEPGQ